MTACRAEATIRSPFPPLSLAKRPPRDAGCGHASVASNFPPLDTNTSCLQHFADAGVPVYRGTMVHQTTRQTPSPNLHEGARATGLLFISGTPATKFRAVTCRAPHTGATRTPAAGSRIARLISSLWDQPARGKAQHQQQCHAHGQKAAYSWPMTTDALSGPTRLPCPM